LDELCGVPREPEAGGTGETQVVGQTAEACIDLDDQLRTTINVAARQLSQVRAEPPFEIDRPDATALAERADLRRDVIAERTRAGRQRRGRVACHIHSVSLSRLWHAGTSMTCLRDNVMR
jgi:hypothetical protein